MKHRFVFIAVLMLLNIVWLPRTYAQVVNIPDPNLAAKIREVLSLNPTDDITQAGMEVITSLPANNLGITDISGLETAVNLQSLDLSGNSIGDVSGISALTELTWLGLLYLNLADISFISGLTKLQGLYLSGNRIRDISALSGLMGIKSLGLFSNQITDISALSGLTDLASLGLADNQITDISALSGLTKLRILEISANPIRSLLPLKDLGDLEIIIIDVEQALEHQDFLARILPAGISIHIMSRRLIEQGDFSSVITTLEGFKTSLEQIIEELEPGRIRKPGDSEEPEEPVQHFQHCGIGWSPDLHRGKRPKAMIYALEFEYANGQYTCSTIEIRTGDDTLSDLDGWQLYLGTLYNPSYIPIKLTHANSQITDNVLRLTPERLGQQTFKTGNWYYAGQPLPSVHYVLKNEKNISVDMAYSCYIWGLTAHMQEKGVWKQSPRRITSQALRAMETPRIERFILDPKQMYITSMRIDDFEWDRGVFSDWLLSASEAPQIAGGNAPLVLYRQLTTSWAALKR